MKVYQPMFDTATVEQQFTVATQQLLTDTSLNDVMLHLVEIARKRGYVRKTIFDCLMTQLVYEYEDPNLKAREKIIADGVKAMNKVLALPDEEDALYEALQNGDFPTMATYGLSAIRDNIRKKKVFATIQNFPAEGEYYAIQMRSRGRRSSRLELWRVVNISRPLSIDMYIQVRRIRPSGVMDKEWHSESFGLERWDIMAKGNAILHPLYLLKHEFSAEDIERAKPLLPYVLAATDDLTEKDKAMSTTSLRKLIRRARKEDPNA